ncbi:MAG: hypothetical protein HRT88_21340, partial [Lentisphaeraceae bacterium]|nr:hypothetical protein [Lentisphaeraceae bacterium]
MQTLTKTKKIMIYFAIFILFVVVSFFLLSIFSAKPDNLGLQSDGQLAKCPTSPNCVSSFADSSDSQHYIAPLSFDGDSVDVHLKIKNIILANSRTKLI